MNRENLVIKLRKKFLPCVLSGALAFSTLVNQRCANNFVEPEPEKPVAMLIAQPTEGDAPLEVNFDGSMSYAREGQLEKYLWDFDGDGEIDETTSGASGAWINHIYQSSGEHDPSLIVEDSQGQKSDKAKLLEKIVVSENVLGQIAFARWDVITEDNWDQHVYVGDLIKTAEGETLVNINKLTQSIQDLEPAWSPDGEEIAFTTTREDVDGDGMREISIYIMNADGSNQRRLTPNIQHAMSPSWSPDGTKIAFNYIDSGFSGIALINPDGNLFTPIYSELETSRIPGEPTWSPDCSEIAFQKYINGNWEIYIMNSNGSNMRNLTNNPAHDLSPDWSPDGSRIAFVSDPNPNDGFYEAEIYLMNPDGGSKIQLTNNLAKELDPDWSPDGSKLVFARRESSATTQDIWIMNADGTNERKVLGSENHDRFPAWRPKIEDQNLN